MNEENYTYLYYLYEDNGDKNKSPCSRRIELTYSTKFVFCYYITKSTFYWGPFLDLVFLEDFFVNYVL